MEGFELIQAGWLSILPPLLAIVLALITKEVILSLSAGVLSGLIIYGAMGGLGPVQTLTLFPQMMAEQIGGNGTMLLFLALLGALVAVVTKAGGAAAYGRWARERIKSQRTGKVLTFLLGVIIFIDDYFNCLTVGTVMSPVTDKLGISRQKLAYLIDATAAPICIIAPVSSWAVAVASQVGEGGFAAFVGAIPFNLYAILTIFFVLFTSLTGRDFGPMAKAEAAAKVQEDAAEEAPATGARMYDLILPVVVLIAASVLSMAYVGGFFAGVPFTEAIGEDPTLGLSLGALVALVFSFCLFVPRKLVSFRDFMGAITEGVKSMVPAMVILVLAWSLSSSCRYMLGTGDFVSGLVATSGMRLSLLPPIIFAVAAFLSFSTGTAWGTFGILLPIVIAACETDASLLPVAIGAVLAGSVFGDHCSPISDTTILSSAGAKCDHLSHVSTQIPYALFVAVCCFVGYILAGFVRSPWLPLLLGIALVVAGVLVLSKKKTPA